MSVSGHATRYNGSESCPENQNSDLRKLVNRMTLCLIDCNSDLTTTVDWKQEAGNGDTVSDLLDVEATKRKWQADDTAVHNTVFHAPAAVYPPSTSEMYVTKLQENKDTINQSRSLKNKDPQKDSAAEAIPNFCLDSNKRSNKKVKDKHIEQESHGCQEHKRSSLQVRIACS